MLQKNIVLFLVSVFLTACSTSPVSPTPEPVKSVTIQPTLTLVTPTQKASPTATTTTIPTPTSVPLPGGWSQVSKTQVIGGLQLDINDKNEGAVNLNDRWFAADPDGCFHNGLFSDEIQKNLIVKNLDNKLLQRDVFFNNVLIQPGTYIYASGYSGTQKASHYGSTHVGLPPMRITVKNGVGYPSYWEKEFDGILWRQHLCFSSTNNRWYHMVDMVFHNPRPIEDESLVSRLAVGWLDESTGYHSFTYYQEMGFEKNGSIKQLVYPAEEKKATDIGNAFDLWETLITTNKHVLITIPFYMMLNDSMILDESYEKWVRQIMDGAKYSEPEGWSDNLADPEFVQWAVSDTSSIRYFTDSKNTKDWYTEEEGRDTLDIPIWTRYLRNEISGTYPIMFIRTISIRRDQEK